MPRWKIRAILSAVALALAVLSPLPAQDGPVPARLAPGKMTLPEGFHATLFAGEPDVVQPIAFCFDDRGRLWVAECYSYPEWQADPKKGKDRVLIFEDTGGDGKFDKRTVFASNLQNVSGIQYGFGGIWLCSTPNLTFIPDKNGDDMPDGPPEVVLDGWSLKAGHNVFNSLTWGPDGWLYGCNGIVATSRVGAPGTPDKDRVAINCGVWRYHPTKKKFEAVAHGTTNPWGLDFDEFGEMFITNCVIDHLWHVVPGGHYQRMYGEDLSPHVYKLMPSICDHIHWGGGNWTSSRAPSNSTDPKSVKSREDAYHAHSEAGGGHAHTGCMIYLGDNWPDRYRGGVFMCNIHGNRINHDILERNGSTYVARHARDFMFANDPWFRGLALQYGPDGGVYVSDWTDTGECHNYKEVDRTNGRIYKITYGKPDRFAGDLAKLSDLELAKLQKHKNEWIVRHARRLLQERANERKIEPAAVQFLQDLTGDGAGAHHTLRAVWALHASGKLDAKNLSRFCRHSSENVRAWGIRLARDTRVLWDLKQDLMRDTSPLVRLHYLSDVPGGAGDRFLMAAHFDDANDPFLSHMQWYAIEPYLSEMDPTWASSVLGTVRTSSIRSNMARRLVEIDNKNRDTIRQLVLFFVDGVHPAIHRDILRGMQEALGGRRNVPVPKHWKDAFPVLMNSPLAEVRERGLTLAVQFGDERAFALLRKLVPDRAQPPKQREEALKTLLFQQKTELVPMLQALLQDDAMRASAVRGLAAFDDPQTPKLLLQDYPKWNADERSDVIQTLSSRPGYALALLNAIDKQAIPRADITSYTIRQLQALKSPEVSARLAKVWGEIRPASADKTKLIAKYKAELRPDALKNANLVNGRALYQKACAICHRLFGEGGEVGPDLTGSQRANLDYVLENVLDPSAIVPREYQVTIIATTAGRTLSGIVKKENDAAVTLQTQNEQVVVPRGDIESRTPTKVSMMPDGLFEQLRIEEVRDLIAYLAGPGQVPLKK